MEAERLQIRYDIWQNPSLVRAMARVCVDIIMIDMID